MTDTGASLNCLTIWLKHISGKTLNSTSVRIHCDRVKKKIQRLRHPRYMLQKHQFLQEVAALTDKVPYVPAMPETQSPVVPVAEPHVSPAAPSQSVYPFQVVPSVVPIPLDQDSLKITLLQSQLGINILLFLVTYCTQTCTGAHVI